MTALKLILKIVIAPVILLLTLAIWICVGWSMCPAWCWGCSVR